MIIGEKGRIFRIAGVSGSGKTTITTLLISIIKESNNLFGCINLREIQCKLAGVKNEEEYRKIPEKKRGELFPFLINRITEIADSEPSKVWFFERHLCSMNDEEFILDEGLPEEHGKRMIGLAVIVANEQQINSQREKDKKARHDRHFLTPQQIAKEQIKEIEFAIKAGKSWGLPVKLFNNQYEKIDKVAYEISIFLKNCQMKTKKGSKS